MILPSQRHPFDVPRTVAYLNCASATPQPKEASRSFAAAAVAKAHPLDAHAHEIAPRPDDGDRTRALLARIRAGVKVVAISSCHWTNAGRSSAAPRAAFEMAGRCDARDRRHANARRVAVRCRGRAAQRQGVEPAPLGAAEFSTFFRDELGRHAELVRRFNIPAG